MKEPIVVRVEVDNVTPRVIRVEYDTPQGHSQLVSTVQAPGVFSKVPAEEMERALNQLIDGSLTVLVHLSRRISQLEGLRGHVAGVEDEMEETRKHLSDFLTSALWLYAGNAGKRKIAQLNLDHLREVTLPAMDAQTRTFLLASEAEYHRTTQRSY